jgi:hypothetical protein
MDKMESVQQIIFMGSDKLDSWDAWEFQTRKGFGWFPEVDEIINFIREKQKSEFIKNGIEWKPEWDLK